jgi:hypothetical protein
MALSSSPRRRGNASLLWAQETAYNEPGSPWENGYIESFNVRLRDELLNGEIFYSLRAAKIIIGSGDVTTNRSGLMPTRLQTTVCARIRCWAAGISNVDTVSGVQADIARNF